MAEISSKQCQNGDINRGLKIKRDVKLYFTKGYVTEAFLCNSLFNPMTAFSDNLLRIPKLDTFIMRKYVIRQNGFCD